MKKTHTAFIIKRPKGLYQAPVWVSMRSEMPKKNRVTEKTRNVFFNDDRLRNARYRNHIDNAIQIPASITLNQKWHLSIIGYLSHFKFGYKQVIHPEINFLRTAFVLVSGVGELEKGAVIQSKILNQSRGGIAAATRSTIKLTHQGFFRRNAFR
jgi:hypothetical protein